MTDSFDIVCVGNAKIDILLHVSDANAHFRFNQQTNELSIKSGDKISVDKSLFLVGGNAANVAIGNSRLGLKTALVAEIGDDELSDKIINALKKENIFTDYVQQTAKQQTSFSVILNYKNERTIFSEHVKRNHDFNFDNISAKFIFLTSIGHEWKNAYAKIKNYVEKTKTPLGFNPGTIQLEEGIDSIRAVMQLTTILFLNKDEAVKILNIKNEISDMKKVLEKLKNLGPKIVVVTDGKNGSYLLAENKNFFFLEAPKCKIVEKTGAGDAYTSGFLSAFIHGISIKEAMQWGSLNAESVIGQIGAQSGLLRKEEMERKL